MAVNPYVEFWRKVMDQSKHPSPHNAWTLSFVIDTPKGKRRIVEHELNSELRGRGLERWFIGMVKKHWPGEKPDVSIHHVIVRRYNPATEKFETLTQPSRKRNLPSRANFILSGVPEEALSALEALGGRRPEDHEILRHQPEPR